MISLRPSWWLTSRRFALPLVARSSTPLTTAHQHSPIPQSVPLPSASGLLSAGSTFVNSRRWGPKGSLFWILATETAADDAPGSCSGSWCQNEHCDSSHRVPLCELCPRWIWGWRSVLLSFRYTFHSLFLLSFPFSPSLPLYLPPALPFGYLTLSAYFSLIISSFSNPSVPLSLFLSLCASLVYLMPKKKSPKDFLQRARKNGSENSRDGIDGTEVQNCI
jgi:hypothetical protein